MSKIILLNGPSSAGKSSMVKVIQRLSDEPWLSLGVDSSHEGINFVPRIDDDVYSIMKVESDEYVEKFLNI
ncbi:MAG: Guanylate kinase [Mycoplasmataceae bacterium]|nr:MAG: Guanylate kinase [Mycoplasmataceae bacterium]